MNVYTLYTIIAVVAAVLYSLFYAAFHRQQVRHIIRKNGYDETRTFLSTASLKTIWLYTFDDNALKIRLITNVILPKFSLINKEFIVPYEELSSVDIGQATLTLKFKDAFAPKAAFLRYKGSIAQAHESWTRIMLTSPATRNSFTEHMKTHGVLVNDVTTSARHGLFIALTSALIFSLAGVGVWLYTLGWFS